MRNVMRKDKIIYCFKEYARILASMYRDYYVFIILNLMYKKEDDEKYYDTLNKYPNLIISIREAAFTSLITNFFKLHDSNSYKGRENLTIKNLKKYISDYIQAQEDGFEKIEKRQKKINKKKIFKIRSEYLTHHDMDNFNRATLKGYNFEEFKKIKPYIDITYEILNEMRKLVGIGTVDLSDIIDGIKNEIYTFLDDLKNK